MSLLKIVATGGTIANTNRGLIGIDEVFEKIPEARGMADFEVIDATRVRSGSMRLAQWFAIARAVSDAAEQRQVDGIIVTHGTFTTEETAYFLHLTIRTEKPLVVVAAQRKHDQIGNDGDHNLLDATRIALSREARGKGVLVTLNEEIHSAREVLKGNQRPGGFVSPAHGILGHVESDRVSFYNSPVRRHTARSEFDIREIESLPRVDIVSAYVGGDDTGARACVTAGAEGLVVHGYAYNGRPSYDQQEGFAEIAASGIPVVLTNRGGQGRVPVVSEDPYIQGDSLVAHKARILLMLGLKKTRDFGKLQRMFDEY